jgi:hypothetical protein
VVARLLLVPSVVWSAAGSSGGSNNFLSYVRPSGRRWDTKVSGVRLAQGLEETTCTRTVFPGRVVGGTLRLGCGPGDQTK